jgi:hypothetical protein
MVRVVRPNRFTTRPQDREPNRGERCGRQCRVPESRTRPTAYSFDKMGLIAKKKNRQSAEAKPTLDNRSHRTHWDSPAPREARCQVQSLVSRRVTSVVVTAQGFAFNSHLCSDRVAQ